MWRVDDRFFLGQALDAQNRQELRAAGVTHILNCSAELPCHFPGEFEYLQLHLKDPDPLFASKIAEACDFIDRATVALVHCQGAISRSPSIVLAYLCHRGLTLQQAVAQLSAIVPTKPNELFLRALAERFGNDHTSDDLQALAEQLTGTTWP